MIDNSIEILAEVAKSFDEIQNKYIGMGLVNREGTVSAMLKRATDAKEVLELVEKDLLEASNAILVAHKVESLDELTRSAIHSMANETIQKVFNFRMVGE